MGRIATAWVLAAASLVLAAGCASTPGGTVSLRLKSAAVPDAHVTIDEVYVGTLAVVQQRGVALPPGRHRISVEHNGYFPWDRVVQVSEGDPPLHLEPELKPIPD
jgi:hypothetical protein